MIPFLAKTTVSEIPSLSVEQMIEGDRAMVEDYGILLLQMMEHAGRHLARERFLASDPRDHDVVVLTGPGGNVGGALVCARRLAGWGTRVSVVVTARDEAFAEVPRHQLAIVRRLNVRVTGADALDGGTPSLVIDGVIGYSLRGAPHGAAAALIRWANMSSAPVLALDVPSGLDATSGMSSDPTLKAAATMTLALPNRAHVLTFERAGRKRRREDGEMPFERRFGCCHLLALHSPVGQEA